jgi:phosphoribosylglycinamide formyltransferase-1
VLQDDDAARLAARVLAAEHRLFPLALRLVAEGRARIVADPDGYERVAIADAAAPLDAVLNPLE